MKKLTFPALALIFLLAGFARAAEEKVFCDFESADFGDWKVEGEAFGPGPIGTVPGQNLVDGYLGNSCANSYHGFDGTKGKLTSPKFTIDRKFISFLVGGGGHEGVYIALNVDGEKVRVARGTNVVAGGTEHLDWYTWDVTDLNGKEAFIEIVDDESCGWGHINIDHIVFGDKKRRLDPKERAIKLENQYLWLPVKLGDPKTWFDVVVDGEKVSEFIIELAVDPSDTTFTAILDVSEWQGKDATLIAEQYPEESTGLDAITQSDELPDAHTAFKEKYRPQFHFSPRRGWTNDPNGLTCYKGEYHLFFQHNPYGTTWNNMSWGHAVSKDLFHWEQTPDAFLQDRLGTIFSGSAVVDHNNTTGFKTGDEDPIVCIYSIAGGCMRYNNVGTPGVGYSVDGGKTWQKYAGNPIAENYLGGDPKAIWYEPEQKWVMALFMGNHDYALFESKNMVDWTKLCDVLNLECIECPDFFELPVDGDENNKKWVFWGGNANYLIGSFDGKTFERETEVLHMKWGGNDYAAQTYSETPGRCIQFSWMAGAAYPGMPFNQQFTVPRELSLRTTPEGIRLFTYPAKEIEALRVESQEIGKTELKDKTVIATLDDELKDLDMTINVGDAERIEVQANKQTVVLLPKEQAFLIGDIRAPLRVVDGKVELRVILDRMSIEAFVNDGYAQISTCFVPADDQKNDLVEFSVTGSGASLESLKVWRLQSVLPTLD